MRKSRNDESRQQQQQQQLKREKCKKRLEKGGEKERQCKGS
jgi:hypothetical protein